MSNIQLPADLTLRSARLAHESIAAVFQSSDPVNIDCSTVTQADLAGVQLLVSATRTATGSGRTLTLVGMSEALAQALTRSGFELAPSSDHIVLTEA
jgi:chemotaxis protein CheX